jgi:hypothetical protein
VKPWEAFEEYTANIIGGKRTGGSGNGNLKGDIRSPELLVECKETSQPYMTVTMGWFDKITAEARTCGKIPVLGLEFGDRSRIYLVLENDFPGKPDFLLDMSINSLRTRCNIWVPGVVIRRGKQTWRVVDAVGLRCYLDALKSPS